MKALAQAATRPVLDLSGIRGPVIIEAIDTLRTANGKYLVRVRSGDGVEGIAVGNEFHLGFLHPLMHHRIVPALIGQDARDWEALLERVYRHACNYKLQGMPFWQPLATIEFAVLDLLGRIAGCSVACLLGGPVRHDVAVYQAFDDREKDAEESVERMAEAIAASGARAAKFKVGGRMGRNADSLPGRTARIIPLARQRLGDSFTLYADANGSFDVPEAIRVGRMLEDIGAAFFEEPVPFDHFDDTRRVAAALRIPLAGGEQDASLYNLRWALAHDALQVVQPDLFYFGGFVRCARVARMAAALGRDCTPHISSTGLGFLYLLHFAAAVPNVGPHQEYKGSANDVPFSCATSPLRAESGVVRTPAGPGLGVDLDPAWVASADRLV